MPSEAPSTATLVLFCAEMLELLQRVATAEWRVQTPWLGLAEHGPTGAGAKRRQVTLTAPSLPYVDLLKAK